MGAGTAVWNSTELDKAGLKCPVHQFWWHGSCWASKCSVTCSRLWQCIWPLGHCCASDYFNFILFFSWRSQLESVSQCFPGGIHDLEHEEVYDICHELLVSWHCGCCCLEREGDANFAQGRDSEIWWLFHDPHAQQNINIHCSPSSAVIEW